MHAGAEAAHVLCTFALVYVDAIRFTALRRTVTLWAPANKPNAVRKKNMENLSPFWLIVTL